MQGPDKTIGYRNRTTAMQGELERNGGDGAEFTVPGRALLLVRNVGHLMTTQTKVFWEIPQLLVARIGDPHGYLWHSIAGVTGSAGGWGTDAGRCGVGVPVVAGRLRQGTGIPRPVRAAGGDRPVEGEYIRPSRVQPLRLTATLFPLAEHGLITLSQGNEKRWTITGIADSAAWSVMDPVSRKAGNTNGTAASGKKLAAAWREGT